MTMFGQPKPFASLSSTLLARKGQARPAMRPQGFGGFGAIPGAHDDLGWNDMGHPEGPTAEPAHVPPPAAVPPVLRQREALHEEFEAPREVEQPQQPVPQAIEPEAAEPVKDLVEPAAPLAPVEQAAVAPKRPVSLATAKRIGKETQAKRNKAAFTLRLDHDRHLRLRLASALHNRSAQVLVTEALDAFLQSLPEVEDLARQLPPRGDR